MAERLFGTDGLRGPVNIYPMTVDVALRLGLAAGVRFRKGSHQHRVVIGKDTRLSGYMFESALTAGPVRRRHARHHDRARCPRPPSLS